MTIQFGGTRHFTLMALATGRRLALTNTGYRRLITIILMFHIIDDVEWIETINAISKSLRNTGPLVIGGNFGWFDGINVKIDKAGNICKRLRSLRRWKRELKRVGFSKTHLYRNNAYLWINDPLPENSVLISEMGKISNEFGP